MLRLSCIAAACCAAEGVLEAADLLGALAACLGALLGPEAALVAAGEGAVEDMSLWLDASSLSAFVAGLRARGPGALMLCLGAGGGESEVGI